MLRNMYRYRYIVIIDFDEFIIPRLHDNYHNMLAYIDETEKLPEPWLSYTFRNSYYFLESGPTKEEPKYSRVLRYHSRQNTTSPFLWWSKSIIDPQRCLSVFNHYCWLRFENSYTPEKWTIDVKKEIAVSQHYRLCSTSENFAKCNEMYPETVMDDFALKYSSSLVKQMLNAFANITYAPEV
jgi:hypothetical protein